MNSGNYMKNLDWENTMVKQNCGFCGKDILDVVPNKKLPRGIKEHVNINREPKRILFCCNDCKIAWIDEEIDKNDKNRKWKWH